jgi:transcriptional regulator with XRE-family HTH domain
MPRNMYLNPPPAETVSPGSPRDTVRVEFARRLQAAMLEKGWNQSELARQASLFVHGGRFGRDNISMYVRGLSLPTPAHLNAVAKALGKSPDDLLPTRGVQSARNVNPPLEMRQAGEDRVWISINQVVDFQTALKLLQVLKQADVDHQSSGS